MAAPLIVRTPFVDDDGTGEYGTVWNNDAKQSLYNEIDGVIAALYNDTTTRISSPWVDVAFSAANFGANGGTWTVTAAQQVSYVAAYDPVRKLVTLQAYIANSTITAGATALHLVLPTSIGGRTIGLPARQVMTPMNYAVAGVFKTGLFVTDAGLYYARLLTDFSGTAFPGGTTNVTFHHTYPIA